MSRPRPSPRTCDHCGASLPPRAVACRECGSDAETGWSGAEDLEGQSIELPEFDEEDYRRVVGEISGNPAPSRPVWIRVVTVVVLLAFAAFVVRAC